MSLELMVLCCRKNKTTHKIPKITKNMCYNACACSLHKRLRSTDESFTFLYLHSQAWAQTHSHSQMPILSTKAYSVLCYVRTAYVTLPQIYMRKRWIENPTIYSAAVYTEKNDSEWWISWKFSLFFFERIAENWFFGRFIDCGKNPDSSECCVKLSGFFSWKTQFWVRKS